MNNNFYPDFEPGILMPLKLVFESLRGDPLWLERSACPYDDDTRKFLRDMWIEFRAAGRGTETVSKKVGKGGGDKWEDLGDELMEIFSQIKAHSEGLGVEDVKERMTTFRTATALLDKIVGLGERVANVKAVSDFQARVMAVFDEILTPDQRTRALEKLGVEGANE